MKAISASALVLALLMSEVAGAQNPFPFPIGPPPAPALSLEAPRPLQPTRFHVWIDGYWLPNGRDYVWYKGYWVVPPYYGARWIPPRYDARSDRYYLGYWNGDRIRQYRNFRVDDFNGSEYVSFDERFDGLLHR